MKKIACNLLLKNGASIQVYFNSNEECKVTFDSKTSYNLTANNLKTASVNFQSEISLSEDDNYVIGISEIEVDEADFIKTENEQRCINCNGVEICIEKGCMKTDCGRICN